MSVGLVFMGRLRSCRKRQAGNAVVAVFGAIMALAAFAYLAGNVFVSEAGSVARTSKAVSTGHALTQAADTIARETNTSGLFPVATAYNVASPAPTGGGQIPGTSAAPKMDAWGTPLGYCTGSPAASGDPVFAVVSAGPDLIFETTCAQALSGIAAGDDIVRAKNTANVQKGVGGTRYFGTPLSNLAAINALTYAAPGEARVALDTGNMYVNATGTAGAGNWTAVFSVTGGSSGTNALTQANCIASNGGVVGVWGTALVASGGCDWNFTTTGTFVWTVPAGVANVSVVCIGGGQTSGNTNGMYAVTGGAGGSLAYKNNIQITAGNTVTVQVGAANQASAFGSYAAASGVAWNPSSTSVNLPIPWYVGDGGGDGGLGYMGGGGAGGYSGNGGAGNYFGTSAVAIGGAATGGNTLCSGFTGNGGGGTGLYGQGANGAAVICGQAGKGGSPLTGYPPGGSNGGIGNGSTGGNGGLYGGGGGFGMPNAGQGAQGACRVVYPGVSRQFPSTLVGPP